MTVDVRAKVFCNLGTIISGSNDLVNVVVILPPSCELFFG